jgi:hypothetical protein
MPFIGNQPALSYTSFAKQDFTTSATTSYTLDNPVANANELALFINFVRQEPTTAYSASGTSLTLTSATSATDDMYCVYLGKAVQTVNPPSGSVGTAQIADLAVTSGKLASGVLPTNTPAFAAYLGSNQSISNATITKMNYDTEVYDTDSAFDTSTYTFTIPSGGAGKYFFFARQTVAGAVAGDKHIFYLYKNNSQAALLSRSVGRGDDDSIQISAFVDASESDYFDIRYYHNFGSTKTVESNSTRTVFGAYKILT